MIKIKLIVVCIIILSLVCSSVSYPIMADNNQDSLAYNDSYSCVIENNLDDLIEEGGFDKNESKDIYEDIDIISDAGLSCVELVDINQKCDNQFDYTIEVAGIKDNIVVNSEKNDSDISLTVTEGDIVNNLVITENGDFIIDGNKVEFSDPEIITDMDDFTTVNFVVKHDNDPKISGNLGLKKYNPFVLKVNAKGFNKKIKNKSKSSYNSKSPFYKAYSNKQNYNLGYNPYPTVVKEFKYFKTFTCPSIALLKSIGEMTAVTLLGVILTALGAPHMASVAVREVANIAIILKNSLFNSDSRNLSCVYKIYVPKQDNPFLVQKYRHKLIRKSLYKNEMTVFDEALYRGNSAISTSYDYSIDTICWR